jgi:hypothetical protein
VDPLTESIPVDPLTESIDQWQPTVGVKVRTDIIATILDLVIAAWPYVLASKRVSARSHEVEIAGALYLALVAEKARRPALKKQLRIQEEVGIRSSGAEIKPKGRIDFKISWDNEEKHYFGIECKRITQGNKRLATQYVKDGIMRFVSGKYSPGHDWGAMIGFVVYGSTSKAIAKICEELNSTRATNCMRDDWEVETSFEMIPDLYRTRHRYRGEGKGLGSDPLINLLHLFLSIAKVPKSIGRKKSRE